VTIGINYYFVTKTFAIIVLFVQLVNLKVIKLENRRYLPMVFI